MQLVNFGEANPESKTSQAKPGSPPAQGISKRWTSGTSPLLLGFAFAADIDRKWSGTITGMDMPIEFTFKAEGKTLTGFHIVSGTETAIKDGKIDGNNISFSVTLEFGKCEHSDRAALVPRFGPT